MVELGIERMTQFKEHLKQIFARGQQNPLGTFFYLDGLLLTACAPKDLTLVENPCQWASVASIGI